ncbi:anoctamin-like protein At1g73020 isoform X3 [Arachis ipaensis]|nr:anoctamin-like protein At1g73020 isoform X3 [Arachis ipaensis]
MKENVELVFEICVVIPKREAVLKGDEDFDCSNVFARELKNASLVVDRVIGNSDEFFKVAAPLETLGRAVAELRIMKRTRIGMDLQFDMVEVDAFIKQPDGSLFSWSANLVVLPAFFIAVILRAITFSQFWKWKNAALLARWLITYGNAVDEEYKVVGMKGGDLNSTCDAEKPQPFQNICYMCPLEMWPNIFKKAKE